MVDAFQQPTNCTPAPQKALLIRSFYLCVKEAGIQTAVIRGIENKKLFESTIGRMKHLYRELARDPEVRKAIIAEEDAESKRIADDARRRAEESERTPGLVTVCRTKTATGGTYSVQVSINGQISGKVFAGERLEFPLPPGDYSMRVEGGGLSSSVQFFILPRKRLEFETYFSNWGILGGGLVLRKV